MRVAVVGTGVIGASWTALFLAHGHHVTATDPSPDAEAALRAAVTAHWPGLVGATASGTEARDERVRGADGSLGEALGRLAFTGDPAEAVAGAEFVQENGPEREAVKDALFAVLDAAAPAGTVLASSSSGLTPSRIQRACGRHPERVLVGHPFNPPHLVPLVEVVPGARTGEDAVRAAIAFYTALGRRPVRVRRELPGHLANRLQAALWREAYALVASGAASVADLDAVIAHGPGLRWALLGPFANQHLSGGSGGIAHVLEHLGPPMEEWWADLGAPRLTPDLVEAVVAGVAEEFAGTDPADVVADRDRLLQLLVAAKAATTTLGGTL
ncbi:3-hydroxyacyl-CoA dehydrogenase NAD-binding domain-containing protein [Actinocorallia sp. API 0066]|uniref:3-hydroxyacyl-CoA dehydrogenase NAD-binding domain-containing protein n=1 Tax=Actinocorallia sp. API 0066 TaxID=2896846 RepID=UPI001E57D32A|nr:3-hydroxyacyl-CoA dehydrogenase NAD-binding domain-containing protein [Actinocorallia sp. API 0066]MCD0451646.1 3-hydroxyacyl-CoA dehydrogenase NAD-binding domain-containing protein [Actinocorallia sp. API 0066]